VPEVRLASCAIVVTDGGVAALEQADLDPQPDVVLVLSTDIDAPGLLSLAGHLGPGEGSERLVLRTQRLGGQRFATTDGRIVADAATGILHVAGEVVAVPRRQFELLVHLMRRPGETIERAHLLRDVWGFSQGSTETVKVHVRRLRALLERDPSCPAHLHTVRGVGYRFEP
jgi:hypothetical protein